MVIPFIDPCRISRTEFDHDWHWVSDYYGDPGVINGTADCSRWECRSCGAEDHETPPPSGDDDFDEPEFDPADVEFV